MCIPDNIVATADDLGLNHSVNKAILNCFIKGYINSTSFLTNTQYFEETVNLINNNKGINNIGLHINLTTQKPVTNFSQHSFLDELGNWNRECTNKTTNFLTSEAKSAFLKEIHAQIDKALSAKISIVHLDSHHHIHTLPCFYQLFLQVAKTYKLKLRLAQTYNEGNFFKFRYRKYINNVFKANNTNYTDYFETVGHFLKTSNAFTLSGVTELMLHPDMDTSGQLIDHYDISSMIDWINFLENN